MTGKNLDYNQFKIPFGQSVQASDEPKPYNTMEPRTFDCIVLGPSDNIQTGWKLLAVASEKVITRTWITVVPMTDLIIAKVESMAAAKQGIRSLKLESRSYNDDVTADLEGVEEDDEDDDPDYDVKLDETGADPSDEAKLSKDHHTRGGQ
jgi:hypothetical protein